MNKHQRIINDIAHVYMSEYSSPKQLVTMLHNWRHYNVEHLVELAMSRVGGYKFVDEAHYDNSDLSETKTGTCRVHDRRAVISGIISKQGGIPKAGDIRAVIYNEFTGELEYFFMPKADWEDMREYGNANKNILRATYNICDGAYNKWESFRVNSFEKLARKRSTVNSAGGYIKKGSPKNVLFSWA